MRKVLLLTYHFPPSGAAAVYRMLGLVRYLPKFGWQPLVVAPPRVPWEPEDTSLLAQVPPDTIVERVPFAQGFFGKVGRYLAPEGHWLLKARPVCNRLIREHRPDAILTSSPPPCVHLLGRWLARRHRLPWAADFRDPWVVNNLLDYSRIRVAIECWLERGVMRSATALIANTPLNREGWAAAYPGDAPKMVTITNGFEPERFGPAPGTAVPGLSGKITILHAGEFYTGRDPRPFFDALQGTNLPLQVDLLGRRTETICDFPAEIARRNLEGIVTLIGQVPYTEAIERMTRADILLLVHTPSYRIGVPAKLYEYLGAGRPILVLAEPDSDIAWVLREAKVLHRIAPPTDVPAIRKALSALVQDVQSGQPAAPDPSAVRQFTREAMAQKVAQCLEECLLRRKPINPGESKG